MRKGLLTYVLALAAIVALPVGAGRAHAQGSSSGVFYHDQSGTALNGAPTSQALALATSRLAFPVRLPTRWPQGTRLQALWVMDKHNPRFAVLYYGDGNGYITCQLHESVSGTSFAMPWAPRKSITVGREQGTLLQSNIGGAYPVSEIVWRLHGVRYDLLGSTSTSLSTVLSMATSIS